MRQPWLFVRHGLAMGFLLATALSATAQTSKPRNPAAGSKEKDTIAIQEIEINAGYYTVKDRERTGSIARVTAKDIEKQPILNPLEALKGRMAGVDIRQINGEPGGGITIRIRGENSIRSTANEPLYLIDGVPYTSTSLQQLGNSFTNGNPMNTINPADIESIEVLKDADATAIYGSRGANGVVLITTKRGKAGAGRLTADIQAGAGKVGKSMELLDTEQYLEMRREAFANNPAAVPSGTAAKDLLVYDQERNTDWQRELLGGTARTTRAQLSLDGGTDGLNYRMGGGFTSQGNVYPGDFGYRRGNGSVSLRTGRPQDRFQSQLQLTYAMDRNDLPSHSANITDRAINLPPNAPALLDADGNVNWDGGSFSDNPMAFLKRPYQLAQRNTTINYALRMNIVPGLVLDATLGYNRVRADEEYTEPKSIVSMFANAVNWSYVLDNNQTTWNAEPLLRYAKAKGKGRWDVLLGATVQLRESGGKGFSGAEFPNDELLHNLMAAGRISPIRYSHAQYRYLAAFSRVNYAYADRYIVNLTARRDGSSRFGPGNRWGNFGAVGAAWLFAEEPVLKVLVPWLSSGKLRGSYGVTGSDQIADYGYLATYGISNFQAYGVPLLAPARIANADYRWESNWKLEAAVEWGMFADRLTGSVAWYRNRSGNQLVGYPLPAVSGFTSVQYNLPATVQNTGWELELQATPIAGTAFQWQLGLNLTFPERRLLDYPNIAASSYAQTYQVGESMNRDLRFIYEGLDPETGLYQVRDVDGSGGITIDDRIWRDHFRTVYGGFSNELRYKGVALSAFFQLDKRERLYTQSISMPGRFMGNQPVGVMRRWRQPGDITDVQQFWAGNGPQVNAFTYMTNSAAWRKDDFFVRLSNLSLAWTVPNGWCGRVGAEGIRLSLQGQNLWVSDTKNRFDPETLYNFLPPLRVWTAGLQFTF